MADNEPSEASPDAPRSSSLGEFIASQRRAAEMSLRQLAERAGISNPYVSQIERGLRKPSAEVLQSLAVALSVSAESLFVKAGMIDPDAERPSSVVGAIHNDRRLSDAQKQALTDVYLAFVSGAESRSEPSSPKPPADPAQNKE